MLFYEQHKKMIEAMDDGLSLFSKIQKAKRDRIKKLKELDMKKQIELSIEAARELYSQGNKSINTILEENFSREELTKPNLPKKWSDIEDVNGYFLYSGKVIMPTKNCEINVWGNGEGIFKTYKQALSAQAMAQLSQLMHVYNDGKEFDWTDRSIKYVIEREQNHLVTVMYWNRFKFLAFHSRERRDLFLKNFEPLIKQYFMID